MIYDTNNNWHSPVRKIEAGALLLSSSSKSIYGENSIELYDVCQRNPSFKCVIQGRNLLKYAFSQEATIINGVTFAVDEEGGISAFGTAGAGGAVFYFTEEKAKCLIDNRYNYTPFTVADENPVTLYSDMLRAEITAPNGSVTNISAFDMYCEEGTEILPYIEIREGSYVNFTIKPQLICADINSMDPGVDRYSQPIQNLNEVYLIINGTEYAVNQDGTVEDIQKSGTEMFISANVPDVGIYFTYNCVEYGNIFTGNDFLKSFTIERIGEESKFFGMSICQKANIKIIDKDRILSFNTRDGFMGVIGNSLETITMFAPVFYVSEVHRDENTNELSITAYDLLYDANKYTVADLGLVAPYTVRQVAEKCASLIGAYGAIIPEDSRFDMTYEEGANLEGTETVREVLNAIAEVTLTICYLDINNFLVFKRLDKDGDPVLTITKEDYIELDSKTNRRLSAIVSVTELGDNVGASLAQAGTTQYVRDNPFLDLRDDVAQWVDEALAAVGGLTINQFECSWRGNPGLEPGDKIALVTKDGSTITSFVLNDTISYDGSLSENTSWHYEDSAEDESNPSTLGEALKKTFAKVDKANQQIEIVAAETTALRLDADSISATVTELNKEVNTKIGADEVSFIVQEELSDGVNKVITSTGFTFDDKGLSVTKSDSEISTTISEDGMKIYRKNAEVLVADNQGVRAEDLHATTYLIVGNNSRFEDYSSNRTGCFWVGNQGG